MRCEGELAPKNEICDGQDDDCDEEVDEPSDPSLCGEGLACVYVPVGGAVCVAPCANGCAYGEKCGLGVTSFDATPVIDVCLPDPAPECVAVP